MKIYFDRIMCERLGIDYGGTGEFVRMSPNQIIRESRRSYDRKHMEFFKKTGMDTQLYLKHERYGWMKVLDSDGGEK